MDDNKDLNLTQDGVENVPGLKHHRLTVCGGPLSVYEAGPAEKPVVILLHGAMYDEARFIWDQMFPVLSAAYHVFAVDLPRHGKSRPWQGTMDRERLMVILDNAFNMLNLEHFSIVGLSMGGGLAIEYASMYPGKVRSMALFEPGGLGDKVDMELFTWIYIKTPGMLRLLSRKYIKANDDAVLKILQSIYVSGSKPTNPERLVEILKDEIKGKFDSGEYDMDDWQLSGIGPLHLKWNLLDRIPLIKCPTLWLRGADSKLVKQNEMERAVALAKGSGSQALLEIIEHAGHILPLEQPEKANFAVKTFLDNTADS